MNRRAIILAPIAALLTVVITAVASGSTSVHLPRPPVSGTLSSAASTGGGHGSGHSKGGSGSSNLTGGYTAPTLPPLTSCAVTVSNPHPVKGNTAETATVVTSAGALVRLQANYARAHSIHSGLANGGSISFTLPISSAPVGVTVSVLATAKVGSKSVPCSTSFTPVP
jgi:hypothetical protein